MGTSTEKNRLGQVHGRRFNRPRPRVRLGKPPRRAAATQIARLQYSAARQGPGRPAAEKSKR